jgi:asparagine synthase (glutamine-hydrolysing)
MCGVAGIYNPCGFTLNDIEKMLPSMEHRGPDEYGTWVGDGILLGHKRLSIIGVSSGRQPLSNNDGSVVVSANGEIFNYIELREELKKKGHVFNTDCDIELIPHLYDEYGLGMFEHMNGQFAFALWDNKNRRLVLGRDRFGISPLFYAFKGKSLIFSSEAKAMLPILGRFSLDYKGLSQVFTFWNAVAPRTIFEGISQLRPGEFMVIDSTGIKKQIYWDLEFPDSGGHDVRDEKKAIEGIRELLDNSAYIRLRADVPVGAYLSGGLDSSILCLLVRKHAQHMETFSVSFADAAYDEAPFQEMMGSALGTNHHVVKIGYPDIGEVFEDVIWHAETPVLRSAPAPMYRLSGLTRSHGIKVVLTGEGSDELFGGYDIFKENRIRRFWSKYPDSKLRPQLLFRLYPYSPVQMKRSGAMLVSFYKKDIAETGHFGYSHLPTWRNTSGIQAYFTSQLKEELAGYDPVLELETLIPEDFKRWHPLNQAQYLEIKLLLAGYLLCSQGERMTMAHSVEGRYPFLDHNVAAFASRIDPKLKLKGLTEKYILKRAFMDELPREIFTRTKQPYGAPNKEGFFADGKPRENISPFLDAVRIGSSNLFDTGMVETLIKKCAESSRLGFRDNSAFVGILSTQMLIDKFC